MDAIRQKLRSLSIKVSVGTLLLSNLIYLLFTFLTEQNSDFSLVKSAFLTKACMAFTLYVLKKRSIVSHAVVEMTLACTMGIYLLVAGLVLNYNSFLFFYEAYRLTCLFIERQVYSSSVALSVVSHIYHFWFWQISLLFSFFSPGMATQLA
jgi:hypothetical protein